MAKRARLGKASRRQNADILHRPSNADATVQTAALALEIVPGQGDALSQLPPRVEDADSTVPANMGELVLGPALQTEMAAFDAKMAAEVVPLSVEDAAGIRIGAVASEAEQRGRKKKKKSKRQVQTTADADGQTSLEPLTVQAPAAPSAQLPPKAKGKSKKGKRLKNKGSASIQQHLREEIYLNGVARLE